MLLPIVIFLMVTLGLLAGSWLLVGFWQPDRARIRQRFAKEFGGNRPDPVSSPLYKDLDSLNLVPANEYALLSAGGRGPPPVAPDWRSRLETCLRQANVPLKEKQFLLLALAFGLALALGSVWWLGWLGAGAAFMVGAAVPFFYVQGKRKARREKFLRQLPAAFELMARVIRAGQSVVQAFQAVAEAFQEPLAGEFANCEHQQNLGLAPEVVFQEMANRVGILELRIFVMAILIQRQAGGNLCEVLDRLALLVRNRLQVRQQVRTLTAEGRLQGLTLVVLPLVMFVAMFFVNRQYAQLLLDHVTLLVGTAACMAIGVLWIRNIVNFEG